MIRASEQTSHVVIACGGTGGHLFPGLAVAEELLKQGAGVTLMISPKDVDQRAVKTVGGVDILTLPAVALQPGSRLSFFSAVARSARFCLKQFRKRRPTAVLAMGGFTSAGPVLAARVLGIPVFLHESNTIPGRANRLLSRFARDVVVGFPSAASKFRQGASVLGTPVRSKFCPGDEANCRRQFGFDPDRPVILVTGGSQGASGINDVIQRALPTAKSMLPHWQWLHLTGPADEGRVRAAYAAQGVDAVVHGFWDQMEVALGAAHAAVTRAGASCMAEAAATRIPLVLVPFPHAADNHQFQNACAFESTGASVLIEQCDLQPENLLAALRPMAEDKTVRTRMQAALEAWHQPAAAQLLAQRLLGGAVTAVIEGDHSAGDATTVHTKKALVA